MEQATEELDEFEQLKAQMEARAKAVKDRKKSHELIAMRELLEGERQYGVGRCDAIMTDDGPVVVKAPHPATFKKLRDTDDWSIQTLIDYVRPCILYPPKDEVLDFLEDKQPGCLMRVVHSCSALVGKERDALGKA